jgi:plasmid stabilization system protein ParE
VIKVGFHPAAATELDETAAFYERHVVGLGEEFIAEVERVCTILGERPRIGARYDSLHRRVLLRRFPFSLIYRTDDSRLTVIAVAHMKRLPRYWQNRD